jgi:SP family facilitated glucose transporter-like MFS transporter 8
VIVIDFPIMQIAEKQGRKKALISLAVPQMAGWILIYFATNPIYLIVSRFMNGFAGGGELEMTKEVFLISV